VHRINPTCNPQYVDVSFALSFEEPFHRATNFEYPHDDGGIQNLFNDLKNRYLVWSKICQLTLRIIKGNY